MKLNAERPWWSQPICQECYTRKFGVPCKVFSPYRYGLPCYVCNGKADEGIYINSHQTMKSPTKKELKEWDDRKSKTLG